MLGADVLVREPLRFLRGIGQHPLALVAEREINRSRNLFADGGVALDLFADGFHRRMRTQKAIGESFVFAQESQQQMLGLDIGRPKLARLIAREEDYPPCLLGISFKHGPSASGASVGAELPGTRPPPFCLQAHSQMAAPANKNLQLPNRRRSKLRLYAKY